MDKYNSEDGYNNITIKAIISAKRGLKRNNLALFFNAEWIETTPKLAPTSITKLDGSTQLSIQLAKPKPTWFDKLFIVYFALLWVYTT